MSIARAEEPPVAQADVSVDDFITGLLAGFADADVSSLSIRGAEFYRAIEDAFTALASAATELRLDLRFRVFLDPVYGDSPVVRDAISSAVQRDLVSLDNPEYQDMRLKIGHEEAVLLLKSLPGGRDLYTGLARHFLDSYPWVVRRAT